MRRPLSTMASAALAMTYDPRRIDRAEAEPPPASTRSLSPVSSRTWLGSTPSHSLMTWAKRLVALARRHRPQHEFDNPGGIDCDFGPLARCAGSISRGTTSSNPFPSSPPAVSPANFPVQGRVRISDRVYMSRRAGLPTCWLMITESGNVPTVCLDGDLRRGGDARGRFGAAYAIRDSTGTLPGVPQRPPEPRRHRSAAPSPCGADPGARRQAVCDIAGHRTP